MSKVNLNYAEYGAANASPVLVFHGSPGSRFEKPRDLSICHETNCRLIVVERPGFGVSEFDHNRSLLDWPNDIARLADSLEIDKFSIVGFSGGGPYAMACGHEIGHRINRISLVGSAAPFNSPDVCADMLADNLALFEIAAQDYQQAAAQLAQFIDGPDALLLLFDASVSAPDKLIFAEAEFRQMYRANLAEALKQGLLGLAYDMALIARPWQFDPADMPVETQLWHGEKDLNMPLSMGRHLQKLLPNCTARFIPDAGHWIMFSHYRQILDRLLNSVSSEA